MAIRIKRNEAGNCINFLGSSNPTYWNACLSGEIDSTETDSVNVINDIITAQSGETQYEFYRIPFTEFEDKDGNSFATAQECADYITANANVIGLGGGGTELTDVQVCFKLDDTSTSVMLDNGYSYGVNTIKAVAEGGTISIKSELGDITHFTELDHTNVCDGEGNAISGGLNDVINYLNELFTVGAFESVVISDPYSTMIADIDGLEDSGSLVGSAVVDPVGNDIGGNTQTHNNNAGYLSSEVINQAGEYFTFDIRGEGQIGFGLVHTEDSYNDGYYSGNSTYANPANFCVGANSSHYGYQFAHFFHPTPNGSWTNYGANTSYSMRSGWSNFNGTDEQADWLAGNPIKMRVGLDTNGYISIDTLRNGTDWVTHSRTAYPAPEGAEYRLGIKFSNPYARLYSTPKVHLLEEAAPTMYFRYIESPDGVFNYPLFATEEEANYYDKIVNGVENGSSHTHTYADDATGTTWYMPEATHDATTYQHTSAPDGTETFSGNAVSYTEITSLTNADLTPTQFSAADITQEEGTNVNIQVTPAGAVWSSSVTITPSGSGLVYDGYSLIQGTLSDVGSDTTYTITVTRANSYGSSVGSMTVTATDVAPAVPVSGFTLIATSSPLVDSDTLDDGSAVTLDDDIQDGYRLKMTDAYVTANILPNLQATDDKIYVGFAPDTVNGWGAITGGDFNCGFRFQYASANSISVTPVLGGSSGGTQRTHSYSSNLGYDFYLSNNGGVLEANYNLSSTDKTSEPTNEDGGSFTYTATQDTSVTETKTIAIAVTGTTADISVSGLSEHVIPTAPVGNSTNWTKALDFSGSNEHAKMVSSINQVGALRLGGYGAQVTNNTDNTKTVDSGLCFAWATAIVFKSDFNSSNQHIWNSGEGASSGNDNIYLRTDANGLLYFGWGREGVGYNECRLSGQAITGYRGIYIAFKGGRFSSSNATAANLANAFDIRIFNEVNGWVTSSNVSTTANWISTGTRTDRTFSGDFTIGGRGGNRNFHGKVASMVVTTLKRNATIPTNAEIELMITDPVKWVTDYKVGNSWRIPNSASENPNFQVGDTYPAQATQVWLMGDGVNDSYSNGMRNYIEPNDQNWSKLQLNSMVSNDIQTVNINGLT